LIVIGIDFSIQFPAVCISRDFNSFKWIACVNTSIPKIYRKFLDDIELEYRDIRLIHLEPRDKSKDSYSIIERSKLVNYSRLVDQLVLAIQDEIKDEDRLIVAIEGISYGAQGNALLDICQSTGMLRKSMLDRVLNGHDEKLFVFSPGELKNAIGAKGNAGKFDVFQTFLMDPMLAANSDLYRLVRSYTDLLLHNKDVKSPFMDMIDSYLAILKVHESLKEPTENVKGKRK
jgi:Holliday junction resolvasome RuvABC endonuclease subunit